ncbi:ubiquitin carboxyl-terminal hydrolase 38 [Pelobates cultripes]|uniref:Ubiquitin carboxyl-terminal hydrolase 38 n=1 Tax=Pelobates cultripes TaxID=61616 RepID=A0AAD1W2D9_PELCU|nr:ubiquitin carboxyl-terminal hydrolase 38 [Pelobates cultripes]
MPRPQAPPPPMAGELAGKTHAAGGRAGRHTRSRGEKGRRSGSTAAPEKTASPVIRGPCLCTHKKYHTIDTSTDQLDQNEKVDLNENATIDTSADQLDQNEKVDLNENATIDTSADQLVQNEKVDLNENATIDSSAEQSDQNEKVDLNENATIDSNTEQLDQIVKIDLNEIATIDTITERSVQIENIDLNQNASIVSSAEHLHQNEKRDLNKELPKQSVEEIKPENIQSSQTASSSVLVSHVPVRSGKSITRTGLKNLGNTCYMNSVLQSLFMAKDPAEYRDCMCFFMCGDHAYMCMGQRAYSMCVGAETAKPYLQRGQPGIVLRKVPAEAELEKKGSGIHEHTDLCVRETSVIHEFERMYAFVNGETMGANGTYNNYLSIKQYEKHITSVESEDSSEYLRFLLNSYRDEALLSPEILDGDNCYQCGNCASLQKAEKTVQITEEPEYLILNLLRFSYDPEHHVKRKILNPVSIPPVLKLPVERSTSLDTDISGAGATSESGHYYCYARDISLRKTVGLVLSVWWCWSNVLRTIVSLSVQRNCAHMDAWSTPRVLVSDILGPSRPADPRDQGARKVTKDKSHYFKCTTVVSSAHFSLHLYYYGKVKGSKTYRYGSRCIRVLGEGGVLRGLGLLRHLKQSQPLEGHVLDFCHRPDQVFLVFNHERKSITRTGLKNLGNTCYMNSVLQSLFMATELHSMQLKHFNGCPTGMLSIMGVVVPQHLGIYLLGSPDLVQRNDSLMKKLQQLFNILAYSKEDSSEYLRFLLNSTKCIRYTVTLNMTMEGGGLLKSISSGEVQTHCLVAQTVSTSYRNRLLTHARPEMHQPNEINNILRNVFFMLIASHFLAPEILDGNNCYQCENCASLQKAKKTVQITEEPEYLILNLLRFSYDPEHHVKRKIFNPVSIPQILRLPVERSTSLDTDISGAVPYALNSVVVHSGATPESGHYYCYARDISLRRWIAAPPFMHVKWIAAPPFMHVKYIWLFITLGKSITRTGLKNLGNTCYMNSVLQSLFMAKDPAEYRDCMCFFMCGDHAYMCMGQRAYSMCVGLRRTARNQSAPDIVLRKVPAEAELEKKESNMKNILQVEDSSEYLRFLLNSKPANVLKNHAIQPHTIEMKPSSPIRFLWLLLEDRSFYRPFTGISNIIHHFLAPEILDGDNCYQCGNCASLQKAEKTVQITEEPEYLILNLLRFSYDPEHHVKRKILNPVSIPPVLKLPVERSTSLDTDISGAGATSESGHYYCYARDISLRKTIRNSCVDVCVSVSLELRTIASLSVQRPIERKWFPGATVGDKATKRIGVMGDFCDLWWIKLRSERELKMENELHLNESGKPRIFHKCKIMRAVILDQIATIDTITERSVQIEKIDLNQNASIVSSAEHLHQNEKRDLNKELPKQSVEEIKPENIQSSQTASSSVLVSLVPLRSGKSITRTGLKNLGNTCYMNSVLQSLFMAKE